MLWTERFWEIVRFGNCISFHLTENCTTVKEFCLDRRKNNVRRHRSKQALVNINCKRRKLMA